MGGLGNCGDVDGYEMSCCALEGCQSPQCPVCRFAGRTAIEIERSLRVAWRAKRGIREELPALKYPEPKKKKT
jgi:hypothetical protein